MGSSGGFAANGGRCFDVFNGDADGICALHMLRLAEPREVELVTGVKRDIALLDRVAVQPGDMVTVLDISLDKNRAALLDVLAAGAAVDYFDHHFAGEIPEHAGLRCHINTAATICTGLIVHGHLQGRFAPWAVVAAFGDNMDEAALALGHGVGLSDSELETLKTLGVCLNYNGYGESVADLLFHPADLYREIQPWEDPLAMVAEAPTYQVLREGYARDMAQAWQLSPQAHSEQGAVYVLPDAPWSRRVSGVFGNALTQRYPERAHAVLTRRGEGGYTVSVRAALNRRDGADALCRQFEGGGGRKAAAGINHLAEAELERFLGLFSAL